VEHILTNTKCGQDFVLKVKGIDGKIKLKVIFVVQIDSMQSKSVLCQAPFKK
jgi:hypothetical protein